VSVVKAPADDDEDGALVLPHEAEKSMEREITTANDLDNFIMFSFVTIS